MKAFDRSAAIYDLFRGTEEELDEQADFWANHVGNDVIEYGSGTGAMTRRLRARGRQVTAWEPSAAMRGFCPAEPYEIMGPNHWEGGQDALACFHVMNYAAVDDPLLDLLNVMASRMAPGNKLAFDFIQTSACLTDLREVTTRLADGVIGVTRQHVKKFDASSDLLKVAAQYHIMHENRNEEGWTETHLMRTFTPQQVRDALQEAEFKDIMIDTMNPVNSDPFTSGDWSLFAVATAT